MNKAVPWSIKGVDFNAREAAKEAARRSGMSLGEWLNSVIADQADELGIDPEDIDDTQRVEAVSRRLARMAPRDHYRAPPRAERGSASFDEDPEDPEDQDEQRERLLRRSERRAAVRMRHEDTRYAPEPEPTQDEYSPRGQRRAAPRDSLRRAPAYDAPYDDTSDLRSQRDADALLDEAVRGLERGSRRHQAQTNATLDKFSQRLAELEAHLNERAEQVAERREERRQESRDERRAKYKTALREPLAQPVGSPGEDHMAAIDRKLSRLVARLESRDDPAPARTSPQASLHALDIARIEEKLNALLNQQPVSPVAEPAGPRFSTPRPPSRQPLADALSQITRRQRDLEDQAGAALASRRSHGSRLQDTYFPEPSPPHYPAADVRPAQDTLQLTSLQKDIANLAASIETIRTELTQRASVVQAAPSEIDLLRKQIGEMNAAVAALAPREAFASLENATRELIQRVESSRQEGVRENILEPIETLVSHLQRAMAEFSPRATIDTIKREIGVIAQSVAAVGSASVDTATLAKLNDQTREIRDLLVAAAARPMPIDNIERQVTGLAQRMDLIAQRGSTSSGSQAVSESVDAIRAAIESTLPTALLHTLEQRVEALGRKIDEAVYNEQQPSAPIETRALEDMMRDIAARLDRPQTVVNNDLSQLEDSMRELARRVDTAGQHGATPAAFDALQEQIERLAHRLDQSDASLGRLPDLHRSIADIIGMLEENRTASVNAAERAAREALSQIGAVGAQDNALRAQIAQEIANLRNGQDTTDRKTRATLTAVHETLEKVVDRLAMIEDGIDRKPSLPRATLDPLVQASSVAADFDDPPSTLASGPAPSFARPAAASPFGDEPSAGGLPRQVSGDDVLRASRVDPAQRPKRVPQPEAPPVSLEDNILLEPGSGSAPPRRSQAATGHADNARAAPQAAALELDEAPGSAQQSFIAAARRARESAISEASGQPRSSARSNTPQRASGDNTLAEARARAKAAAAALAAAETVDEAKGIGAIGRARAFLNQRKRPILLSLAGIVLALGALTVVRSLNEAPPPERATVGALQPVQRDAPQKIQTQAQTKGRPPSPGNSSPVTADEVAALGNNFVRDPNPVAPSGTSSFKLPPQQQALAKPDAKIDASPVGSIPEETKGLPMALPSAPKGADLRSAAAGGNPAAQFELAARMFEGRTMPRDLAQAAQWFEKAALQDFAPAQYRLGSLYEKGIGVTRDAARAKTLYQRAADHGNIRAMHNLAVLYAEGADGKPDYTAAAQWFRKAAEYGVRDSQYNLAILYARGLGTAQDISQSWIWFSLASAQGDEDAGKKRNDVAGRLNAPQLAAAKAIVDNFKPRVGDKASNEVIEPPGGWDQQHPATASSPKLDNKPENKSEKRSAQPAPRPKMTAL
jgi:localization factor PodJL